MSPKAAHQGGFVIQGANINPIWTLISWIINDGATWAEVKQAWQPKRTKVWYWNTRFNLGYRIGRFTSAKR